MDWSVDLEYSTLLERWKIEPMAAPTYRRIPSSDLKPGMIVLAPPEVNDPDLGPVALSTVWPDHPAELLVTYWHPEDGETSLDAIAGPVGSIDYNILDLPEWFMVRVSSIPRYSVLSPLGVGCRRSFLVDPDAAAVDAMADRDLPDDAVCVDWRLAMLTADGTVDWTGSAWDYIAINPDDRARVMALRFGDSFVTGGGSEPRALVVRLPWNDDG